jgi:hypothetical protein
VIDLTITARNDGTGDDDGMRLAEIERTLRGLRRNGAVDDTRLDVRTNRAHRIRQITALDLDDGHADDHLPEPEYDGPRSPVLP